MVTGMTTIAVTTETGVERGNATMTQWCVTCVAARGVHTCV